MTSFWMFMLLWGVWLITPAIVDGLDAITRLAVVWHTRPRRPDARSLEDERLPTLSIIVPAHNEAEVIDRCLNSLKVQDYPPEKLEVVVVDDGSTDGTAERVENHIDGNGDSELTDHDGAVVGREDRRMLGERAVRLGPFKGKLSLVKNGHAGKAHTLNAGVAATSGEIVVNIDSDVVLAPGAARAIATAFARDPDLGAATGDIEIDWTILEDRDADGRLRLDENGEILTRRLSRMEMLLAKCQFLEYVASFRLGRQAQAATGTLYTLAGACSAFRREVYQAGCKYRNRTVSEDTDLTLDLHNQKVRIGYMPDAKVYLEPVVDWDAIYAQRVRWTRGQLEVCGVHSDVVGSKTLGWFSRFALPQMLLFDHTLAFPRLLWTPLLLVFPALGYSWGLVIQALIGIYVFYTIVEMVNVVACFAIVDEDTKTRLESSAWALLAMPLYRFVIFHFRFSGFLLTLREPQSWSTPGPVQRTREELSRLRSVRLVASLISSLGTAFVRILYFSAQLSHMFRAVFLVLSLVLVKLITSRRSV